MTAKHRRTAEEIKNAIRQAKAALASVNRENALVLEQQSNLYLRGVELRKKIDGLIGEFMALTEPFPMEKKDR